MQRTLPETDLNSLVTLISKYADGHGIDGIEQLQDDVRLAKLPKAKARLKLR